MSPSLAGFVNLTNPRLNTRENEGKIESVILKTLRVDYVKLFIQLSIRVLKALHPPENGETSPRATSVTNTC